MDLHSIFLRFFTTSFELRAVDRSVFYHLLPGPAAPAHQALYRFTSAVTALQAAAQLEVACLPFRVLRDELSYLSIDLSFAPRLLLVPSAVPVSYTHLTLPTIYSV